MKKLLFITLISILFASCARDCWTNGGKPIKENSKRSQNHFDKVKS